MFKAIGNFFRDIFGTTAQKDHTEMELPVVKLGPEKSEIPEPIKCGCGRSSTGFCVGLHKLTKAEWDTHNDNPNKIVTSKVETKPKRPRTKKIVSDAAAPAKKPVVKKDRPAKTSVEKKVRTKKQ